MSKRLKSNSALRPQQRRLACRLHGRGFWYGTVICAVADGGCGRIWHLGDETHWLFRAEEACTCGQPIGRVPESPVRPICQGCFEDREKRPQA